MSIKDHQNPDGTWNGVGVLSELTGLTKEAVQTTFESVKANNMKLETCQYHEFILNPDLETPESPVLRHMKYKCVHCEGTINPVMYRWFELGRHQQRK